MKSLYHAGAVMASGGLVALLSFSLEMLVSAVWGLLRREGCCFPWLREPVANVAAIGPERALTGPVRRGDSGTIARNLSALGAVD